MIGARPSVLRVSYSSVNTSWHLLHPTPPFIPTTWVYLAQALNQVDHHLSEFLLRAHNYHARLVGVDSVRGVPKAVLMSVE